MYLSRIAIDTNRYETMRAMHEREKLHGMVESSISGDRQRTLWRFDRLNDTDYLLLLSAAKPDMSALAAQIGFSDDTWETKDYTPLLQRITAGSRWRFRLTANPTKSLKPTESGTRGKVQAIAVAPKQREWLIRQGETHGFLVDSNEFDLVRTEWLDFSKKGNRVRILSSTFEGVLTVTDVEQFKQALTAGIGRGKAYGMGLLTVMKNG